MVWFNISYLYIKILKIFLHVVLDVITSLLNPWELDQYFNNP